jgi:hypothetical protein
MAKAKSPYGAVTNQPTIKLTPWRSVFLEKLIVTKPVKKFPALYGTRKFINMLTRARARHWSLS